MANSKLVMALLDNQAALEAARDGVVEILAAGSSDSDLAELGAISVNAAELVEAVVESVLERAPGGSLTLRYDEVAIMEVATRLSETIAAYLHRHADEFVRHVH